MARRSRMVKSPPQVLLSACVVGPAVLASVFGLMQLRDITHPADAAAISPGQGEALAMLPVLPGAPRISFGAFPREAASESLGHFGVRFLTADGLTTLSTQTGLRVRGSIVYLPITPYNIKSFRSGQRVHYLVDEDLAALRGLAAQGVILRFALEPLGENRLHSTRLFAQCPDVLGDIAATLSTLGPCSVRVASELNLYDSRYHVPTTSEASLKQLQASFREVHKAFKAVAPNVVLSFSVFIPNGATERDRERSTALIRRYLPYVLPYVDMLSGTFYPHAPEEVDGLLRVASVAAEHKIPLGIDELGCLDEATFQTVMGAVTSGQLGDLRYLNFFDYHVQKSSANNTWHLKDADKLLLRQLREQGVLDDNADQSWHSPVAGHATATAADTDA